MTRYKLISLPHYSDHFFKKVEHELGQIYFDRSMINGISMFGSARMDEKSAAFCQAYLIAKVLGMPIITGGGPGIMRAANKGAKEMGQPSYGALMTFLTFEAPNEYVTHTRLFEYFFTRKLALTLTSRAIINMIGGFGTLDEAFEVLALKDRNVNIKLPVIFVGTNYYQRFSELMHRDYDLGYLRRHPTDLFYVFDKTTDIVDFVKTQSDPDQVLDPVDTSKVMRILHHAQEKAATLAQSAYVGLIGSARLGHPRDSNLAYDISTLLFNAKIPAILRGNQWNAQSVYDAVLSGQKEDPLNHTALLTTECEQDQLNVGNGIFGGPYSIGGILRLFEQKVIMTRYAKLGHIFFPGGTGTKDYLFELLCLMQTKKTSIKPLVLMGKKYWTPWLEYMQDIMVPSGTISVKDLDLFHITDSPKKAVSIIATFNKLN